MSQAQQPPRENQTGVTAPQESTVGDLTLEQTLKIAIFARQAETLSREEAQKKIVELYKKSLIINNRYLRELKERWGIVGSLPIA